jgi:hypothetical protein
MLPLEGYHSPEYLHVSSPCYLALAMPIRLPRLACLARVSEDVFLVLGERSLDRQCFLLFQYFDLANIPL